MRRKLDNPARRRGVDVPLADIVRAVGRPRGRDDAVTLFDYGRCESMEFKAAVAAAGVDAPEMCRRMVVARSAFLAFFDTGVRLHSDSHDYPRKNLYPALLRTGLDPERVTASMRDAGMRKVNTRWAREVEIGTGKDGFAAMTADPTCVRRLAARDRWTVLVAFMSTRELGFPWSKVSYISSSHIYQFRLWVRLRGPEKRRESGTDTTFKVGVRLFQTRTDGSIFRAWDGKAKWGVKLKQECGDA